ncbi:cold shock domain-containing protein [Paenibacillus sp. FSL K6-1566]|uniref:cold shock domain-containing protein n=1 Tax=Paenibacillus sp. FSL K6-1566 TaxID=2954515 RepID=UPI0031014578
MFIEGRMWNGLDEEEMAGVYSRIVYTGIKSPVAPPKPNRKANEMGKAIGKAVEGTPTGGEFTGTIAAPIKARGFGFISPDHDEREIFFHISDSPNAEGLKRGTRVRFDLKQNIRSGKTTAINVQTI